MIETRNLTLSSLPDLVFVDVDVKSNPLELAFANIVKGKFVISNWRRPSNWPWKRTITNLATNHFHGKTFITSCEQKGALLMDCLPKPMYSLNDENFHTLHGSETVSCITHAGEKMYKCPSYVTAVMMKKFLYFLINGEGAWHRDSTQDFIYLNSL